MSAFLFRVMRPQRVLLCRPFARHLSATGGSGGKGVFNTPDNIHEATVPEYKERTGETLQVQKARIVYQSRKRGMLENDLLLSTFAAKYLDNMTESQVNMYDTLINKPQNEWDIFYWITGQKEVPNEYDNEVMKMLKEFAKNKDMEDRTRMPNL